MKHQIQCGGLRVKTVSEYKRNVFPQCDALSPSVLSRAKLFHSWEGWRGYIGAGAAAAEGRRSQAAQQENLWRRQRLAQAICVRQARCVKKIAFNR